MSLYVGPYVYCRTQMVDGYTDLRSCRDTTCSRYDRPVNDKVDLCLYCGGELGWVTVRTGPVKSPDVRAEAIGRRLRKVDHDDGGVMWVVPQRGETETHLWLGVRLRYDDPAVHVGSCRVTAAHVTDSVAAFEAEFGVEIAALRSLYADARAFEVQWGLVSY